MTSIDMIYYNEKWLPIPGYEGRYEVSNCGRVKSLTRTYENKNGNRHTVLSKILRPQQNIQGYLKVRLYKECKWRAYMVHRLVLLAFVGESKLTVDHINSDAGDNRLENLRYCSQRQNNIYSREKLKTSSKYVGVSRHSNPNLKKPWRSSIIINKKSVSLGFYADEYEAHLAYKSKCDQLAINNIPA